MSILAETRLLVSRFPEAVAHDKVIEVPGIKIIKRLLAKIFKCKDLAGWHDITWTEGPYCEGGDHDRDAHGQTWSEHRDDDDD